MVLIRSELTQPELPSVWPIRLFPREAKRSDCIGPAGCGHILRHEGVADGHRATDFVNAAAVGGGVAGDRVIRKL